MKHLFIFNHNPYDGSDIAWNGLRLAENLHRRGEEVRIFLMSDAVDLARESTRKPESYDHDLVMMLKAMFEDGVALKVCGTCMARCGLYKNQPYFDPNIQGTMDDLATWMQESERVVSF